MDVVVLAVYLSQCFVAAKHKWVNCARSTLSKLFIYRGFLCLTFRNSASSNSGSGNCFECDIRNTHAYRVLRENCIFFFINLRHWSILVYWNGHANNSCVNQVSLRLFLWHQWPQQSLYNESSSVDATIYMQLDQMNTWLAHQTLSYDIRIYRPLEAAIWRHIFRDLDFCNIENLRSSFLWVMDFCIWDKLKTSGNTCTWSSNND